MDIGSIVIVDVDGTQVEAKVIDIMDDSIAVSINGRIREVSPASVKVKETVVPVADVPPADDPTVNEDIVAKKSTRDIEEIPNDQPTSNCVCLLNLAYKPGEDALAKALQGAFSTFGEIKRLYVQAKIEDPAYTGSRKAWIEFADAAAAAEAVSASGEIEVAERPVRIVPHSTDGTVNPHQQALLDLGYPLCALPLPRQGYTHGKNGVWLEEALRQQAAELYQTSPAAAAASNKKQIVPINERAHSDCWFCLANPSLEKHLLVSIEKAAYVALAKGPVTPSHVICVPIRHVPSLAALSINPANDVLVSDMLRTANQLREFELARGNEVVVFERYIPMTVSKAMHMQLHVIPFPQSMVSNVREGVKAAFQRGGFNLQPIEGAHGQVASAETQTAVFNLLRTKIGGVSGQESELSQGEVEKYQQDCASRGYVYISLPGNNTARGRLQESFIWLQGDAAAAADAYDPDDQPYIESRTGGKLFRETRAKPQGGRRGGSHMPINFVREVIAKSIGLSERANWKECTGTVEEEGAMAMDVRKGFAAWKKENTN